MIDKNKNVVMVVERATTKLDVKKDENGKGYILEGIFTTFGVMNKNNRVYEEDEFLPHLEYLNKKISRGRLVGELDHPEKFDISLDKASHIIESLVYNKADRTITGRIRLLSTPSGKIAQNLIDDGVQLSISSRAAGVVRENNTVQIKKVFTYDLVGDPGFDNATLTRINESVGYDNADDISIFDMNMSESELDRIISSIDMSTNVKKTENNKENIIENNHPIMEDKKFVSKEDLEKFHSYITEQFNSYDEKLNDKILEFYELSKKIKIQEKYLEYITNETNKIVKSTEELDTIIGYTEHVANEANKTIEYTKYISEALDRSISYQEHQANEHNQLESYISDYLVEQIDNSLIENEKHIGYTRYLAELVDKGLQYTESVAEEVKYIIEHNDEIVENVNLLIGYTDLMTERINAGLHYSNYLSEEINRSNGDLDTGSYLGINENRDDVNILIDNSKTIGSKIDKLVESISNQKNIDATQKANNAYFGLLTESKKKEFLLLTESQKEKVISAVKREKPLSGGEFVQIWEKALNPINHDEYVTILLNGMPSEYKPVWESLDKNVQERIIAQSKYTNINLNNQYAISDFWQTRNILNEKLEFQPLNEAELITENEKNKALGYSDNHLNYIANSLKMINKNK